MSRYYCSDTKHGTRTQTDRAIGSKYACVQKDKPYSGIQQQLRQCKANLSFCFRFIAMDSTDSRNLHSQQSCETVLAEADTLGDYFSFSTTQQPLEGQGLLIIQVSRPRPIRHNKLRRTPSDE